MQFLSAFVLSHYLVYMVPVCSTLYLTYRWQLVSRGLLKGAIATYLLSFLFYKPHRGKGWAWFRCGVVPGALGAPDLSSCLT
jgi:hypothetical protein